ncbi:MAG: hypothetical protein HY906_28250 [Deltaproteobacteria bacterium]|nr:hypothetical protein [Deltaproteobacteria bacterium]
MAGNALFTRCLEEIEQHVRPSFAVPLLVRALTEVGAIPEQVTLGHFVRALELSLPEALRGCCDPDEADAIIDDLSRVLDGLAGRYFAT